MNSNHLIKLVIILTISSIITFLVYKVIAGYLPDFSWDNQKLVSCFIMILIMTNIVYNVVTTNAVSIFSSQLLAWMGIFFLIIIGYAFRFELNYATERVISVLVPSYSWVNKHGEIVIARNSDGHFYIGATINGKKVKFMIDTGASDVALTTDDAKMLGFDLSKLNYTRKYSTANGTSSGALITLDNFKIGEAFFKDISAHVGTGGLDISLLGMSLLERFKGFRIDRDMLILNY